MPSKKDAATTAPAADTASLIESLLARLYRADQLDFLHLSLINLLEMTADDEIEMILDQPEKSAKHKQLFLEKVVAAVSSPELKEVLNGQDITFFRTRDFEPFLHTLQHRAQEFAVVKLSVAIEFTEADLREMAALMGEKIGHPTVLAVKVEKDLVGGAVVQYGSYLSDYSLKTQLDVFRSKWHRAVIEN